MTVPQVRTAVVTGASRGIGHAIASRLARDGWSLVVSARAAERLDAAAAEFRAMGAAEVRAVAADMGAPDDVERLGRAHVTNQQGLDLLVLAAGLGVGGAVAGYPLHKLDRQFSVNVRAPFQLVSQLLPMLRAAAEHNPERGARIVAISSITGHAAEPGLAAYGASKAALSLLCETLTAEEGEHGVSATAIAPGFVNTDMAAWTHDTVAPGDMMKAQDIAEMTVALTRLSRNAAVPAIVMTRPGPYLYRA